jgi:hypothetical protein
MSPGLVLSTLLATLAGSWACGSSTPLENSSVARVSVDPGTAGVNVGGTVQLHATAYDSADLVVSSATISWSSSASAIASVSTAGLVTGVTPGTATITAAAGGRQGTAQVTVVSSGTSVGTITVHGSQQFQTMTGWEAQAGIGQAECDPRAYEVYKHEVIARAADEVGINRIRVGLRTGFENPIDQFARLQAGQLTFDEWKVYWFQLVNDNSDPFSINPAGFNWGYLDYVMDDLVVPLRQRLAARGASFWLSLSYTGARTALLHRDNADEYAEFVLAAFQHLQQKYGIVPNSLEIVNEPDIGNWSPPTVARSLLAAKLRLNQAGFTPEFVGPSASTMGQSLYYFDLMALTPGVTQALDEMVYHRYGTPPTPTQLQQWAQRGTQHGLRTAMLEHGGSGHEDLHADLTLANVSAWQQFGLAFCAEGDNGGVYFPVSGARPGNNTPNVRTGAMTKFLRQYFRYVELGAVRLGASSSETRLAPVAFRNLNGKHVVVVKASAGGTFSVGGLPAGRYGIDYTTAAEYMQPLSDVTITGSQAVTTTIPAAGVLTIFAR